jgi:hypothetical protein
VKARRESSSATNAATVSGPVVIVVTMKRAKRSMSEALAPVPEMHYPSRRHFGCQIFQTFPPILGALFALQRRQFSIRSLFFLFFILLKRLRWWILWQEVYVSSWISLSTLLYPLSAKQPDVVEDMNASCGSVNLLRDRERKRERERERGKPQLHKCIIQR